MLQIALTGNPNVGKSSLFNSLTGLNQKVGNFPGVTVEKRSGYFTLEGNQQAQLTDLPGTYSMHPKSPDERVVYEFLSQNRTDERPDIVLIIADASNLKRNLLLYTQIVDLGYPVLMALNMQDVAESKGINIDIPLLAKKLKCPVIPINARKGKGIPELKLALKTLTLSAHEPYYCVNEHDSSLVENLKERFDLPTDYSGFLLAHHYEYLNYLSPAQRTEIASLLTRHLFQGRSLQAAETIDRYATINRLLSDVMTVSPPERPSWSIRLDKVLTHRIYGYAIFLLILVIIFQSIFSWASIPMDLLDEGIAQFNHFVKETLPKGTFNDLVTDGVIAGLGGIIIFIPQIALLFAFISILEDTGYMSRVMFIMDRLMRRFGLNGRSVVPLVSGVACAVPAIMSTRVIDNRRDRLVTIFVTPFMSCSARLPVFSVLIALVIPAKRFLGIFQLQGIVLLALYMAGVLMALLSAMVVQHFIKKEQRSFFIMEFPVYKWPRWKNVLFSMYDRSKSFVFQAGKVILAVSIILWALANYGPADKMAAAETETMLQAEQTNLDTTATSNLLASKKLEASYAGILGKSIEPAIRPMGFDWKLGIALITSFAAREVFVGTMSTIYSLGSENDDTATITDRMRAEKNRVTGEPFFTLPLGVSLLLFYLFAMQCMSTLATTYRETLDWRMPIAQLVYMTGIAYLISTIVYQLFS